MVALPKSYVAQARRLLIGATVLWGLSFPLMRGLQVAQHARLPALPFAAISSADMAARFFGGALLLLPFYGRGALRLSRDEWSQAAGLAFFGGMGIFLQCLGLFWTEASVSAFLTQLYMLIIPLLVATRERRWPTLRTAVACLFVLIGAALLNPGILAHFKLAFGELLTLIATAFLAGQILWVERPRYVGNRAGPVTFVMFALMGVFFAVTYPVLGGTASGAIGLFATPPLITLIAAAVLLCTAVTFFIMNKWQRRISATEAGTIYCLEPVFATLFAAFLPGWISLLTRVDYRNEVLSWGLLAGGALILGSTILVATERRPLIP